MNKFFYNQPRNYRHLVTVEGCEPRWSLKPDMRCGISVGGSGGSSTSEKSQQTNSTAGATSPVSNTHTGDALTTSGSGPVVKAGIGSKITFTDGGAINALQEVAQSALNLAGGNAQQVVDSAQAAIDATTASAGQSQAAAQTLLQQQLGAQSSLASNVQSGGASGANKTWLILAGIAAAVFGFIFWLKNKRTA